MRQTMQTRRRGDRRRRGTISNPGGFLMCGVFLTQDQDQHSSQCYGEGGREEEGLDMFFPIGVQDR